MSNRLIFKHALDCFADPSRRASCFDLYAENIVLHGYAGVEPRLESVKRYYEAFWSAFPDGKVTAEDIVEEEEKMAVRFLIRGTHLGPILNIPAAGKTVFFSGMAILRFEDGKCVERWSVTDSISLLVQLGVNPIPD